MEERTDTSAVLMSTHALRHIPVSTHPIHSYRLKRNPLILSHLLLSQSSFPFSENFTINPDFQFVGILKLKHFGKFQSH